MSQAERPLGVICAMPTEIEHLRQALDSSGRIQHGGFGFDEGRLDGRRVVLVESGVGKVNAALVATLLLTEFDCPTLILSGVAGGLDPALGIGDVVVGERLIQHDYGAMIAGRLRSYRAGSLPIGDGDGRLDFALDPGVRDALHRALDGFRLPKLPAAAAGGKARTPAVRFGTIVSGDQFINCEATRNRLFSGFSAQAVEMEGGAVAQVAERFGADCVVVRSLSDLAGADSHLDLAAFMDATATTAARVVRRVLPAL